MKNPSISVGFIIFDPLWRQGSEWKEVDWQNGHWRTAKKWIDDNNLKSLFGSIIGKNNIYDEEDFLMEYIGAIKLYVYDGNRYCYVPHKSSIVKSRLKEFFQSKGYIITGYVKDESEAIFNEKMHSDFSYNQTVICIQDGEKPKFCYNPFRIGD